MGESWLADRWRVTRRGAARAAGLLLAVLVAIAGLGTRGVAARSRRVAAPRSPSAASSSSIGSSPWSQVERLIAEQRLQDAVKLLQRLQKTAQVANREAEAARAAIRLAQVRMTLSNYEMAVTVLQDQLTWQTQHSASSAPTTTPPEGERATALARATLAMFYAQSLVQYGQMYSFQVGQREHVAEATGPEVPFVGTLRAWTTAELFAQTQLALVAAWEQRAALGEQLAAALPEYVEPGNQPPDSRPTLRDLFTYQYVEFLANRQHWRADQQRGIPVSEVAILAHLDGTQATADRLKETQVHPLAKLAALLGDLVAWHQATGRNTAALEAGLERLVRLHGAFSDEARRAAVRAQLGELIQASAELPYVATAQAVLAELLRSDFQDHPDGAAADQLERAQALAMQGMQRSPDSPASQRCRAIGQALAASEFHLASTAGTGGRSLQVTHRNLATLHFRAYRDDPEQRLQAGGDDLEPTERELAPLLRSGKPVAAWTTPLAATPDLQSHVTLVTPPLEEPGGYLLLASERADFALTDNRLEAVRLQLSDLILWATAEPDGTRVTAVSGRTGEPLAEVEIAVYQRGLPGSAVQLLRRVRTGRDGSVSLPERGGERERFLVGRLGSQFARLAGLPLVERERAEGPTVLVYTDSGMYRPGQKVRWKLVAYQAANGAPKPLPAARVRVTLTDADSQQVTSLGVTTSQFGTASGELTIPAGRRAGPWQLATAPGGATTLYVEDSQPVSFLVSLGSPDSPPKLGQPTELRGAARYTFGAPVKNGRVHWRLVRRREATARLQSGEPAEPEEPAPSLVATGTEAIRPDGTFRIPLVPEADPASERTRGDEPTWHFQITAELTDDSGETNVAQHELRLFPSPLRATIQSDREFALSGQPIDLRVTRRDLADNPVPGTAHWRLLRLPPLSPPLPRRPADSLSPRSDSASGPTPPTTPAPLVAPTDRLHPRTDSGYAPLRRLHELPDGPEQASGELTHGPDGQATLRLAGLPAGAYRLRYQSRDATGQPDQTVRELVVVPGPGARTPADALGVPALLLRERARVKVGDTARFAIASALADQALFVEIRRAGVLTERRLLHAGRDPLLIELPVQPTDRGGITVALTTVVDHQLVRREQSVGVPWDDRALQLEVSGLHDHLQPEAKETFRITAQTADGQPAGPVELLAYMYDRRLARIADYQPPDLSRIHASQPELPDASQAPRFLTSLGTSSAAWRSAASPPPPSLTPRPDRLKLSLNYRLGELARSRQSQLPERAPPADRLGVNAPHPALAATAFFQPHLLLSTTGSATVEFTAPDSATEWNLVVAAQTADLRVGMLTRAIQLRKELSVQSQIPRFLRAGDRIELQTVVGNSASRALSGQVRIEIFDPTTGADLRPLFGLSPLAMSLPFRAPSAGQAVVSFPVTAPAQLVRAAVRIVATAETLSAGEQRPLYILPAQPAQSTVEEPRSPSPARDVAANVESRVGAALLELMRDAGERVDLVADRFFAACLVAASQKSNAGLRLRVPARPARKAESGAVTAEQLQLAQDEQPKLTGLPEPPAELPAALVTRLSKAQTESGGFAWFPGGPPSPYWTLYVVNRLSQAAELGGEVPADVLRNAWWYLGDQLRERVAKRGPSAGLSTELLTFLSYAATMAPNLQGSAALSSAERQQLMQLSQRSAAQLAPLGTAQLALTLKRLGQAEEGTRLLRTLLDTVQPTSESGSLFPPAPQPWLWSSDHIEAHALVLRALLELQPADPRISGLVQWLLRQSSASGWKSSRTSVEVVSALGHYLKSHGRADSRPAATSPARAPQPGSELVTLTRRYFLRTMNRRTPTFVPVTDGTAIFPGDQLEVELSLRSQHPGDSIQLRDPRPAGFAPIGSSAAGPRYVIDQSLGYYQEQRASVTHFFFEELPAGQYSFRYRLRASAAGTFRVPPATVQPLSAPEFSRPTAPAILTIQQIPH